MEKRETGSLKADGLILATPTPTHVSLTKSIIGSGLAVLIEKPLAVNGAEGRELLRACRNDKDGIYMVGHHRRHGCYANAVKTAIEEGNLGTIVGINGGQSMWQTKFPCF